jgi:hypothetical protein
VLEAHRAKPADARPWLFGVAQVPTGAAALRAQALAARAADARAFAPASDPGERPSSATASGPRSQLERPRGAALVAGRDSTTPRRTRSAAHGRLRGAVTAPGAAARLGEPDRRPGAATTSTEPA